MKQPASDPRPPNITTTNTIGPIASAMPDSVDQIVAARSRRRARPADEPPANTMVNTSGTLWPSALTMPGWVSDAWMIRPMRVFFSSSQVAQQHAGGNQQHEAAIRREFLAIQREQREIEQGRHAIWHRQHAPCHLHASGR